MISKQAALDILDDFQTDIENGIDSYGEHQDRLWSLSEQFEWIPCSERLPYAEYGESDTVLTTVGYRDDEDTSVRWTRLLYFDGGNWVYPTGETYEAKVYAWMPLPEPYREEGE